MHMHFVVANSTLLLSRNYVYLAIFFRLKLVQKKKIHLERTVNDYCVDIGDYINIANRPPQY